MITQTHKEKDMARYDYKCMNCNDVKEEHHRMVDNPVLRCDKCGGYNRSKMIVSVPEIIYSCKGFYNTDREKYEL